jgi:hypothetical protein
MKEGKQDSAQWAWTVGEPITAHSSYVIGCISYVPYVYCMGRAKCVHRVLMKSCIVCMMHLWTAKQDVFAMRLICTYVCVLSDMVTAQSRSYEYK